MRYIFFTIFASICLKGISQFNVKWSELMPIKGRVLEVLPVSYSDFYTTRYQGGLLVGSTFLSKHSNFSVTSKGKITAKLEEGFGQVEQIMIVKDSPIIFISDKKDGKNTLYFQKYANTCEPVGLPKEIATYEMPKGWKRKGAFWVHQSQNKEYFVVDYEIPGKKEEKDRFGYVVYTSDLEKISEGEYELPYEAKKVAISNNYLSNTGDYFLAAKIFTNNESGKLFRSNLDLEKIVLMHVTPNGIEEFDLQLKDGKYITNLTFSSDNKQLLTFTGLYSNKGYTGVKGIFYFQLDFNKKTMLNEGWEEFPKEFITEGWSDRAKKSAEKRAEKGKGEPELYEYDIRNVQTLKDGSMIGMLEQYYHRVVQTYNAQTRTYSTTTYYYYNDVIVYKINKSGKIEWIKKIKKYQSSVNDNGYFSSIANFHTDDKLYIFFNDNLKNYNETGQFIEDNNRIYPTSYSKKSNTFSKVEIDLQTGELNRTTFFERNDTKAFAVPKKFCVDYTKNEMLMLLVFGKKEKYGVLSF